VTESAGPRACDRTIQRLLDRASRQAFKFGDLAPSPASLAVSLPATRSSLPEYFKLDRFADRDAYHARLQAYIDVRAIHAEWDRRAGERGQLARITLTGAPAAAQLLRVELPWVVAQRAIRDLEAVAGEGLPPIDYVAHGWSHGKAPGGVSAAKAHQFVDGMRVVDAARRLGSDNTDVLLRRLSVKLFADSKRIEALAKPIAFLLGEPDEANEDDHVFARLGLVKHPQPMLISGPSSCQVRVNDGLVQLIRPYLGLRPDTMQGLEVRGDPIQHVVTIENLASFNEAAEATDNPADLLLIYVAGNPTPTFLRAYGRLLGAVSPAAVLHWGDIDLGGFRIAARLASQAITVGYRLDLWRMNPAECGSEGNVPDPSHIKQVLRICDQFGWTRERAGFEHAPIFQEQEFLEWQPPQHLPVVSDANE
jgi:hypothetical protein